MNHGYQDHSPAGSTATTTTTNSGPRAPAVELGLDAARHFGNILRLLESSHGYNSTMMMGVDTLSTVWHSRGKCWWYDTTTPTDEYDNDDDDDKSGSSTTAGGVWRAASPLPLTPTEEDDEDQVTNRILFLKQKQQLALRSSSPTAASSSIVSPRLLSLTFSDHCTALAKVVGVDGGTRYLSLLRLEEEEGGGGFGGASGGRPPNDGWLIVQEVMVLKKNDSGDVLDHAADTDHHHHDHSHHHSHDHNKATAGTTTSSTGTLYNSLLATLHQYLEIEHGGGAEDVKKAQKLFVPQTSLLSVGAEPENVSKDSDWLAPYGTLLEIPLSTYLAGVESQVPPHTIASKQFDAISTIDMIVTPSTNRNTTTTHAAAAATVRVGNGAQTRVFEDHLLLGWCDTTHQWNILSKVYSPQTWPSTTTH
jgi:hypothetical protein